MAFWDDVLLNARLASRAANQNPYQGVSTFGLVTSIGGAAVSAIGSFFAAESAKSEYKSQKLSAEFAESMSAINASAAERDAQALIQSGNRQVSLLGLQYAQEKAAQRTSTAAAGVVVGTGSSAEALASTELAKKIDAFELNLGTVSRASRVRAEAADSHSRSLLAGVSARNFGRSARTISPVSGAAASLLSSAGSVASQWVANRREELYYRSRF